MADNGFTDHVLEPAMFLQKYSSKTYQGISSSKTKSNAISKEQKCYAEKVAPRKHLTGEGGNGLCFTETSLSKISQPRKQASETDNFNPHWRVGFFFLPPSVKNHTRGERRWAFPLSPHKQRLLTSRQSASPRWFRGSCSRVNYLPSNKRKKCSLHWTAKLWPLGPICEICVCRIRSLIFFFKGRGANPSGIYMCSTDKWNSEY